MYCWHTQLREVDRYLGPPQVRVVRDTHSVPNPIPGVFAYVRGGSRGWACPAMVVESFKEKGYAIVCIELPEEA